MGYYTLVPIRVLPEHLRREIAAGEIIARPSDAVKELLENALDAGATRIEIGLKKTGLEQIRVFDDGVGIPKEEVVLALERFATSKLEQVERIETLGFRGEALWSMAFAADVVLITRPKAQLGGVRLSVLDGEQHLETTTCAAGTTVEVNNLFARFPARKAGLESPALETRRVLNVVQRYVLHHPQVAWRVVVDGEVRLNHTPSSWREAVATVYGAMTANRLLTLEQTHEGVRVTGVVTRPELARPRSDRMHVAINNRPVELEENIELAVLRAFSSLLPKHHSPSLVLNLTMPPEWVNHNAHPGKLRVALLEAKKAEAAVQTAIAQALGSQPLAPSVPEPRIVQAPAPIRSQFPELRLIGTYRDAYMIAESLDGDLWLLDQHAAHERILFEELEASFANAAPLELPKPELLTLPPDTQLLLETRREELQSWGFVFEDFGGGLFRVASIPAALIALRVEVVVDVLARALNAPDARRDFLARLACLPAIKAGHRLERAEASLLLEALRACAVPWACPHGRPTALKLSERDVAHQFGRRSPRDVAVPSPRDVAVPSPRDVAVPSPRDVAVPSPRDAAQSSPRDAAQSSPRDAAQSSPRDAAQSSLQDITLPEKV
jgi:DNA mismatch repair protein MutL